MTVVDRWKGLDKAEIARRRKRNLDRWQRQWYGPDRHPDGRLVFHKQGYKEAQKVQADLDDANQKADPKARQIAKNSITIQTLVERHLDAKADRAPKTVEADGYHGGVVVDHFGDRVFGTLTYTEIEIWAGRKGTEASSRKKQLELLRAAIQRGIRDKLIDEDPTDGLVISLGHKNKPHWDSEQLAAVVAAAPTTLDQALLSVLGFMGVRSGEARSLQVGDLLTDRLSVMNSGAGSDQTKTRASRRVLPVPPRVLPLLQQLAGDRPKAEPLFPSPRRSGRAIASRYPGDALTRAVVLANRGRNAGDQIKRIHIHGLRHTFAFIALSELDMDVLTLSAVLGHSKPSTTYNEYGHFSQKRVGALMDQIDTLVPDLDRADTPQTLPDAD